MNREQNDFNDDQKALRVYYDENKNKYFVEVDTAYCLGLITYETANDLSDNGSTLYEISLEQINYIIQIYKIVLVKIKSNSFEEDFKFAIIKDYISNINNIDKKKFKLNNNDISKENDGEAKINYIDEHKNNNNESDYNKKSNSINNQKNYLNEIYEYLVNNNIISNDNFDNNYNDNTKKHIV